MDYLPESVPTWAVLLVAALLIILVVALIFTVVARSRKSKPPVVTPSVEQLPPEEPAAEEIIEQAAPRAPPAPVEPTEIEGDAQKLPSATVEEPELLPAEEAAEETEAEKTLSVEEEPAQKPGLEAPVEMVEAVELAETEPAEIELVEELIEEEEKPEAAATRFQRLRARLARSGSLGNALLSVLSKGDLSETDWEELEDTLLMADVGLPAVEELMDNLRREMKIAGSADAQKAKEILAEQLLELVGRDWDRSLNLAKHEIDSEPFPATVLVVGVNGTGKTTSVGKLARLLRGEDKTVLLGAADTFRAAAAEQLTTWGDRVGVEVVRSEKEGGDPAAVAFETVAKGKKEEIDVVLIDTAGRLQTKSTLMDELGKIRRVMEKHGPVSEVLLVLDATTGQNGLRQAEVFAEAVGITGIILTKLDGSAKGGIVISVQRELGVPVKLVGLGEGPDDLAPFDPEGFVDAIIGE